MASGVQAAGVFLPATAVDDLSKERLIQPNDRLVGIDRRELARARDEVEYSGGGTLLLNVDFDRQFDVVVQRTTRTALGYTLSGRTKGPSAGEAVGFVTLVVHDEAVAGAIWTPDGSYEIVPLGDGVHAVREVAADVRQCAEPVVADEASQIVWPQSALPTEDQTVVDVLVVWTPQREAEAGGAASVRAEIDLAIAYTNDAFARSGAFVSLNLVGAEPVMDYEEPDVEGDGTDEWPMQMGTDLTAC